MTYQVVFLSPAESDVEQIATWLGQRSPAGALAWLNALEEATVRLKANPLMYAVAPENEHFDYEIRQLLFRTRRARPYRLLYTIANNEVRVLHVRGPGQKPLTGVPSE